MPRFSLSGFLCSLLIPSIIFIHLVCSPLTKIEESFSIQATHDIIAYGIPTVNATNRLARYDHVIYPGNHPVPRSFVGPLLLAGLSSPLVPFLSNGLQLQIVARGMLGLFNALSLLSMRRAVNTAYGKTAGVFYVLFQASQFHVMYYASRPLPNMFAFGATTFALSNLLLVKATNSKSRRSGQRLRLSLYLLTIAGIVLRSEVAILLACETLYILIRQRASLFHEIIPTGLFGALIGLFLTIPLDSYMWHDWPLWPEFAAFWFNTIEGKSSDWGTSPWHFYFTSAIPRLLLNPLTWILCIPLAINLPAMRRTSAEVLLPALGFVALYSLLPHKETRFVMYIIPSLTAVAAGGASWVFTRRRKSTLYTLLTVLVLLSIATSFIASLFLLAISSLNYPGGVALARLHELVADETLFTGSEQPNSPLAVHIDTLAFHTGAIRFLEIPGPDSALASLGSSSFALPGKVPSPRQLEESGLTSHSNNPVRWTYDKTDSKFHPDLLRSVEFWDRFDYALMEHPEHAIGAWEVLDTVYGYGGIRLLRSGDKLGEEEDGVGVLLLNMLGKRAQRGWKEVEAVGRKVTRGRWVGVRMEPKIRILKRQRWAV